MSREPRHRDWGCLPDRRNFPSQAPISRLIAIAAGFALFVAGCAPAALRSTRNYIAEGNYPAAHDQAAELLAHPETLRADELREARDALCTSEFMIGSPRFTASAQYRTCAEAAAMPGSTSAEFARRVESRMLETAAARVETALNAGDLAEAEQAAIDYRNISGHDPAQLAKWSHAMWQLVAKQDPSNKKQAHLSSAIAELRRRNPGARAMDQKQFVRWVAGRGAVDGKPFLTDVALDGDELKLAVPSSRIGTAALSLDRFAAIEDAMIARCGCDAKTNVADAETHFPLYLVRLRGDTGQSEVLVLPR
ncbi:MAG TPA: hypothetical protein VEF07_01410 [Candidatus Binataceae bacterium]|nr:hypothetical protein [Candidatus Binataceae bacterium]